MKIKFSGKEYKFFSEYTINLIYNAIASTFSFQSLNSILGQPLVYSFVEIFGENDELLLTGYILSSGFVISSKPEYETYPGYSITGVLEDCSVPFPSQSDNLTLKQIVEKLLKPFNLKYVVDPAVLSDMNKTYKKSTASDDVSIKDYISELASQRGIILTHTNKGELYFTKINPDKLKPVASFKEGQPGATNISLTANGQQMHSDITVVRQASESNPDAGEYTIKNPYVTNRYRPVTKILSSGEIFDLKKAARNELAKELMGIEVVIETTQFIKPGSLVEVQSDRLKLRVPTKFFVTQTDVKGSVTGITYTLKCVLPDVYSDSTVKNVFI